MPTNDNLEPQLRELLLPVFGLDTIAEVQPHHSLVRDLGAESLDFVEIMYLIERTFGVVLKNQDLITGGAQIAEAQIFTEGKLTTEGATVIGQQFPNHIEKIRAGLSKADLFSLVTVADLAKIIQLKMANQQGQPHAEK